MKKYFLFLLILFCVPTVGMGADSCTNPKEYTVDRRCYVTDEQKKEKPFNAVVRLVRNEEYMEKFCSGAIVKKDDKLYIYTAKHCVAKDKTNWEDSLTVITTEYKYVDGKKTYISEDQDFAVYSIDMKNLPYVYDSPLKLKKNQDIRIIGYTGLKIMSDEEIQGFRQKYLDYLKNKRGLENLDDMTKSQHGFTYDGKSFDGILIEKVGDFINDLKENETAYYNDIFQDDEFALKISKCTYTNGLQGCQGWRGNSGSGVFDKDGNISAVVSEGLLIIGGLRHARVFNIADIAFQPQIENNQEFFDIYEIDNEDSFEW